MTLGLPLSTLYAFLLVLARVGGLVAFLPVPGIRNAPETVRAGLALALTIALFPAWPNLPNQAPSLVQLLLWGISEAGFGLAAGLTVSLLLEALQIGAQVLGLQAGYGYSTTIDPTSQADAGILQILNSLFTGMLFFTLGLDRQLMRILAASFEKFPAGSWAPAAASAEGIVRLGAGMFSIGLRIALPVVALLLLIDIALALLGRIEQQLQLLSLAFPAKMLAALAILSVLAPALVRIFGEFSERAMAALWRSLGA